MSVPPALGLSVVLLGALILAVLPSPAVELKRLVLHDFNCAVLTNNVGGACEAWSINPDLTPGRVQWRLDASETHGAGGYALHLAYTLPPGPASQIGFRTNLQGIDASDYDHLEFWIKGQYP